MRFEFKVVNEKEVNYGIPYNGNNGNYEICEVYLDGAYITDITVCDWNVVSTTSVVDNLHPDKPFWMIRNGLLISGTNSEKSVIVRTKSHRANKRNKRGN